MSIRKFAGVTWAWTPIPEDMPEGKSVEKIADSIKEAGFEAIDFLGTPEALDTYFTREVSLSIGEHIKEIGLEPNVFVFQENRWNSPEPAVIAKLLEGFEQAAATAQRIGCRILSSLAVVPWGAVPWKFNPAAPAQKVSFYLPEDYDYPADWKRTVENYRRGLEIARRYGLRMSIECFPGTMISTPHAMLQLLQEIGADDFGIQLDTNHLIDQHIDPEWTIRVLGGRHIFNVHCKDNDAVSRGNIPAGTGVTDYTAVIRALEQVGYEGNLTVELEFTDNPRRYNKQSLDHLRLCLEGLY